LTKRVDKPNTVVTGGCNADALTPKIDLVDHRPLQPSEHGPSANTYRTGTNHADNASDIRADIIAENAFLTPLARQRGRTPGARYSRHREGGSTEPRCFAA
jgi:hypothetical protein